MLAVLTSCAADRGDATAPPFEDAGTTSIGAAAASTTAPPIQSIAMVGDSITNGSKVELLEQLATLGVEIKAIDAEDSRRIAAGDSITPGIDVVRALAAGDAPDLWVIALGTNDVGMGPEVYTPGHRRARRGHSGWCADRLGRRLPGRQPGRIRRVQRDAARHAGGARPVERGRVGGAGRRGRRPARRHPSLRLRHRAVRRDGDGRRR